MTADELVKQVLKGILLLVGAYRGSHAEMAGYVDKKTGQAIHYIRGIHLVECIWYDRVDRAKAVESPADAAAAAVAKFAGPTRF